MNSYEDSMYNEEKDTLSECAALKIYYAKHIGLLLQKDFSNRHQGNQGRNHAIGLAWRMVGNKIRLFSMKFNCKRFNKICTDTLSKYDTSNHCGFS